MVPALRAPWCSSALEPASPSWCSEAWSRPSGGLHPGSGSDGSEAVVMEVPGQTRARTRGVDPGSQSLLHILPWTSHQVSSDILHLLHFPCQLVSGLLPVTSGQDPGVEARRTGGSGSLSARCGQVPPTRLHQVHVEPAPATVSAWLEPAQLCLSTPEWQGPGQSDGQAARPPREPGSPRTPCTTVSSSTSES